MYANSNREESVNLNVDNEKRTPTATSSSTRIGRFSYNRSRSEDNATEGGGGKCRTRRLSNQISMEMARKFRCSSGDNMDVVDDAVRNEDLDEIQVHVTNARSLGLTSSFLRRKKDEYEGDEWEFSFELGADNWNITRTCQRCRMDN